MGVKLQKRGPLRACHARLLTAEMSGLVPASRDSSEQGEKPWISLSLDVIVGDEEQERVLCFFAAPTLSFGEQT